MLLVSVGLSLLVVSLPFGMAYLTYTDASLRSSDHPTLWGLLGLFVPIVGALGYRAVRPRLGDPTGVVPRRARWLRKWVRFVAAGLAILLVVFLAWVTFLSPMSFSRNALWSLVSMLFGLGLFFWLVPTWPDDIDQSPPRDEVADSPALSWRGKLAWLGGLVACLFVSVWSVRLFAALDNALLQLFVVILCLMTSGIVVGSAYRPYLQRAFPDVRSADEPFRSQYADRCRAFGYPVNGVWVAADLKGNASLAEVAGSIPGYRHLVLDEAAFQTYDDRERLAVLAQQVSLADGYYWVFSKSLVYVALLAYYGLVVVAIELTGSADPFPEWPLVPELLLVALLVLGVWHGRRKVYRADKFAADRTSVEAVVSALESLDARNEESDEERIMAWLLSTFWTRPSPGKRVERLRDSR